MPAQNYTLIRGDAETRPMRVWHDNVDVIISQDESGGDTSAIILMRPDKAREVMAAIQSALDALEQ